jgi:transcriptional regulator GlxA family with amidase domain
MSLLIAACWLNFVLFNQINMSEQLTGTQKKVIVIVVPPDVQLMHAAGPCDVFTYTSKILTGSAGFESGAYEVIMASTSKDLRVVSNSGMAVACSMSFAEIPLQIDTLIIAGSSSVADMEQINPDFYTWLTAVYPYVRRMVAICTGAFVLAKAGLLDHKTATTHYEFCPVLKRGYPEIKVDTNPFFVKDGKVYTSGGVSSGINLSLALIEEDHGRDVALKVARKLVLELKRPGNQAQFSDFLPAYELKSALVKNLRPWLMEHIAQEIKVEQMAEQANMSPRNFARVFLNDTGLTPAKFIEKLRVEAARKYLENSDLSIEQIAGLCGLGSMVSMRRVFLRHLEISPSYYRNSFQTALGQELNLEI